MSGKSSFTRIPAVVALTIAMNLIVGAASVEATSPSSLDATPAAHGAVDQVNHRMELADATMPVSTLPGGASSLQESYQDWRVACAQQAAGKRCTLSQQQFDPQTRQRAFAIEVAPSGAALAGILVLPFGLNFDAGITLQIDEGAAGAPLRFRTCLPQGCLVPINLDSHTLSTLRRASVLKVKAMSDSGQEMSFTVSLKGFAPALDRTIALTR